MNSKLRTLFESLCRQAQTRRIVGSPDKYKIETAIIKGKQVPEHLLPGRFIMNYCTVEERELLKNLTSDNTIKYRPLLWAWPDKFTGDMYV